MIGKSFSKSDFVCISSILDEALASSLNTLDEEWFAQKMEDVLTQLDVLPFDESKLPQTDSVTL